MTMKPLTETEINDYVNLDLPLKSCGSYMFEKNGYYRYNLKNYTVKYTPFKSYVILTGKDLGTGELKIKVDITAHHASKQAKEKIEKVGGKLNILKK